MPESAVCPEAQNVHLLLLGRLTPQEAARIRAHVGQCHLCAALLEGETLTFNQSGPPLAPRPASYETPSPTPTPDATVTLPAERTARRTEDDTVNLPVRRAEDETVNLPGQAVVKGVEDETLNLPPPPRPTEAETVVCDPGPGPSPARRAAPALPTLPREKIIADVFARLSPPQATDEIGRLGPFRVLGVLGAGSVGAVFQAEDLHRRRLIALKVLHPSIAAEPRARQHFVQAAQETAALQHEHLVTVHEVGAAAGTLFVAMQLLKGETLDERLRRSGALPVAEVLRVGQELAEGLAAAHARNLCHGDLGLADVWLEARPADWAAPDRTARGPVKLLDLGLKQALRGEARLAPQAGMAADLFALGFLLYRMATGCAAFPADTPPSSAPPNPCQKNPALPQEVGQLVVRLLSPPGSGPAVTAREAAQTLGALAEDAGATGTREWKVRLLAEPRKPGEQTSRPEAKQTRRHGEERSAGSLSLSRRRWLLVGGVVLLAAALALGAFLWLRDGEDNRPDTPPDPREKGEKVPPDGPAGQLQRSAIPPHLLAAAGGDRAKAPPELVAILGDARLRHPVDRLGGDDGPHQVPAQALAYSAQGGLLATAASDPNRLDQPGEVKIWDAATGKHRRTLNLRRPGPILQLAFSPDGKRLAAAGPQVDVWDTVTGELVSGLVWHTGPVHAVAFSPDGKTLATGSADRTVRIWDPETGKLWDPEPDKGPVILRGHTSTVSAVAYLSHGGRLVSGGLDGTVRVWDLSKREEEQRLEPRGPAPSVTAVAVDPQGKHVAAACLGGSVVVWEMKSGQEVHLLRGPTGAARAVAFSPDGNWLASAGSADQRIHLWDARKGEPALTLRGDNGPIHALAFSPDGKRLTAAGGKGRVLSWEVPAESEGIAGHAGPVYCVAVNADGTLLASGGADRTVRLWDLATGKQVRILGRQGGSVRRVAFSPDGTAVAAAGDGGVVELWETATGKPLRSLPGHAGQLLGLAFTRDGTLLATAGINGRVRILNRATGAEVASLVGHDGAAACVAFRPEKADQPLLISGGADGLVKAWELPGEAPAWTLRGHRQGVNTLSFSADGRRLASGGSDQTIRLWELAGRKELHELTGHTGAVTAVAFRYDGKRLVSAGRDGAVHLWDLTADPPGTTRLEFFPSGEAILDLALTPAGRHAVTANQAGTIYVLRLGGKTP